VNRLFRIGPSSWQLPLPLGLSTYDWTSKLGYRQTDPPLALAGAVVLIRRYPPLSCKKGSSPVSAPVNAWSPALF